MAFMVTLNSILIFHLVFYRPDLDITWWGPRPEKAITLLPIPEVICQLTLAPIG